MIHDFSLVVEPPGGKRNETMSFAPLRFPNLGREFWDRGGKNWFKNLTWKRTFLLI